jgi:hypothetical protein
MRLILASCLCLFACQLFGQVPDGSVIFLQGGPLSKTIKRHTDSPLTHTAIVLYDGNEPWVYEASPPRVSRTPLAEYLNLLKRKSQKHAISWFIMQPRVPYSESELVAMKNYANSQLGRPYMIRGWWKGREVRGLFCSEYAGNIIGKSGRIVSADYHESPGSLHIKLSVIYETSTNQR